MGEHYTRGTLETTAYCARCKRMTQHRVDHAPGKGGRLGPCIDPKHPVSALTKEQERRRTKADKERRQPRLFE